MRTCSYYQRNGHATEKPHLSIIHVYRCMMMHAGYQDMTKVTIKTKKTHWFISFGGDSDAHWEGSTLLGLGSVPRRTIYISPEVRINIELGGVPSSNVLHSY